jgi:hypothetical protein
MRAFKKSVQIEDQTYLWINKAVAEKADVTWVVDRMNTIFRIDFVHSIDSV